MKSPFPGMDPFLEDKSRWTSVHARLIVALSDQLSETVAPDFYVDVEQRIYITSLDDPEGKRQLIPDIYVIPGTESQRTPVATANAAIMTPTLIEPVYIPEIRDRYLEIRDTHNHEVITTITLLSPFNKTPGHQG
ncbi:MAG: DUF4058 family protein, partial [Aquificales bacterium]|nr:DUF4058 family protein [Aquificales bacterium]